MNNILFSGGAPGADCCWGSQALKYGHQVIHWSFDGHNHSSMEEHTYRLTKDDLSIAQDAVKQASKVLNRPIPKEQYILSLLQRSYFQVTISDAVYAVGYLNNRALISDTNAVVYNDNEFMSYDILGVDGGTAWTIQMFCNKQIDGNIYFYDMKNNQILLSNPLKYIGWIKIGKLENDNIVYYDDLWTVPRPSGYYAGIGSRKMNTAGEKFIELVYI